MENVVNTMLKQETGKDLNEVINELLKLSPKEIANQTASVLNKYLPGILDMTVDEEGGAKIVITLTSDQLKYVLKEFSNSL